MLSRPVWCSRNGGKETREGPNIRLQKSLRAGNCKEGAKAALGRQHGGRRPKMGYFVQKYGKIHDDIECALYVLEEERKAVKKVACLSISQALIF